VDRIPAQLRSQWMPFQTSEILFCLTPAAHLETVLHEGLLPHDDYFSDIHAIVLAYSKDPLYGPVHTFSVEGFRRQGLEMIRLHICTANRLYRSLFPNRTYQVISMDPISSGDIVKIEKL
jgi:hypothetical protein